MSYCKKFQAVLITEDAPDNDLVAYARCKMWSCPHCAEVNRSQWRMRVFQASEVLESPHWSFITITAHSRMRGEASLRNLQDKWPALRKRLKRKYGAFHFVRVYELHADGSWHLHALLNFHFDDLYERKRRDGTTTGVMVSKQIRDTAKEIGLGWYTHAENMRTPQGAAVYITKYMTKSMADIPSGIRRIQTSQGFPKLQKDGADYKWRLQDGIYEDDMMHAWRRGRDVYNVSEKRLMTADDFVATNKYHLEMNML